MENYYQSIDIEEFSEWYFFKEKKTFTTKELDRLTSRIDINSLRLEKDDTLVVFFKKGKKYSIAKFADDWFIVDQHRKAWKCDGFRAVIKLLDDI